MMMLHLFVCPYVATMYNSFTFRVCLDQTSMNLDASPTIFFKEVTVQDKMIQNKEPKEGHVSHLTHSFELSNLLYIQS